MNVLSRILRLEKDRPKVFIDDNTDNFYTALLGVLASGENSQFGSGDFNQISVG